MRLKWWILCTAFNLVKAIAVASTNLMDRINKKGRELIKEMEERP